MAGGQERILRRRIRSVQSTRKITKAMELIAASRIVRAQNRIAANRPFREGMERVLRLTAAADPIAATKLLGTPESPSHVGILAVAGDRGLAGSYNSGVLRLTERMVAEHRAAGTEVTVWSVGKKAPPYLRYRGIEVAQSFVGVADRPEFGDARHIAAVVAAPFVAGDIDLVQMVSTRFISAGTQRVEAMQMLPLPLPDTDEQLAEVADSGLGPFLADLRAPSDPMPSGIMCPDFRILVPWFELVDSAGTAVNVAIPTDQCGAPKPAVIPALQALHFRVTDSVRVAAAS